MYMYAYMNICGSVSILCKNTAMGWLCKNTAMRWLRSVGSIKL